MGVYSGLVNLTVKVSFGDDGHRAFEEQAIEAAKENFQIGDRYKIAHAKLLEETLNDQS